MSSYTMEWTVCNLCGADDTTVYRSGQDRQLGGGERFQLVRCLQCGLIYLNPRPTPADMARYYPSDYEPFTRADSQGKSRLGRWGYERWLDKRCDLVTAKHSAGRLLDVGCATGEFLLRMRQRGWDVEGVEPSGAAAGVARDHGLRVHAGELIPAALPAGLFDVVTLWDVLEHVPDPAAELTEIARILKPDGLLVIELPNVESWDAHLFGACWIGLDMPRHLYLFPTAQLTALLARAGFRVLSRRTNTGGYGALMQSARAWAAHEKPGWLLRLLSAPIWQVVLLPYIYLAYAAGKGPQAVLLCRPGSR